jgi:hypothetical protein
VQRILTPSWGSAFPAPAQKLQSILDGGGDCVIVSPRSALNRFPTMHTRHFYHTLIQRVLPCLVAFATVLVVSCYPYPEKGPNPRGPKPVTVKPTPEKTEAEKLKEKEQLAKDKKAKEEKKKAEEEKKAKEGKQPPTIGENENKEPEKPPVVIEKRAEYEVAKKAPGREGFVLSPYNKKLVDVRGFKSGDLVADPTYDKSEKKYFRVP